MRLEPFTVAGHTFEAAIRDGRKMYVTRANGYELRIWKPPAMRIASARRGWRAYLFTAWSEEIEMREIYHCAVFKRKRVLRFPDREACARTALERWGSKLN